MYRNFLIFLIFFISAILDVSFLSRLSLFGSAPILSLALLIILAVHFQKGIAWAIIPSAIFAIFSQINMPTFFILFLSAYIPAKFLGNRFKDHPIIYLSIKFAAAMISFLTACSAVLYLKNGFSALLIFSFLQKLAIFASFEVILLCILSFLHFKIKEFTT